VVTLAGRTDVLDLAALLARARLLVANDSGVAHLAVAVGTPSVVLCGPVPPAEWGPPDVPAHRALWKGRRGDPHAVALDPGLAAIGVAEVLDVVTEVLAATAGRHPRSTGEM
jgi:ADP-heptose:LPS heptosyltransferase